MAGVLECVLFRLRPGITPEAFLDTVPATDRFLRTLPGFVRRRLGSAADGEWHDHVEWASMEAALVAARAFMAEPSVAPFNAMIDPATSRMRHFSILAASDGETG